MPTTPPPPSGCDLCRLCSVECESRDPFSVLYGGECHAFRFTFAPSRLPQPTTTYLYVPRHVRKIAMRSHSTWIEPEQMQQRCAQRVHRPLSGDYQSTGCFQSSSKPKSLPIDQCKLRANSASVRRRSAARVRGTVTMTAIRSPAPDDVSQNTRKR